MDLIDRQTAIKTVQAYHCRYPEYMDGFVSKVLSAIKADLVEDIKEVPTAEPPTDMMRIAIQTLPMVRGEAE